MKQHAEFSVRRPRGRLTTSPRPAAVTIAATIALVLPALQPARSLHAETTESEDATEAVRLLARHCQSCHNPEKEKGGLVLTSLEALRRGSDNGDVVHLDDPVSSPLVALLEPEADPHMPPRKQLDRPAIETITRWIQAGTPWPETVAPAEPEVHPIPEPEPLPDGYQPVQAIAFSPDATRLAAGRGDSILIITTESDPPELLEQITPPLGAVLAIAWSPDGSRIAAGGYRRLIVWNTESWSVETDINTGWKGMVSALSFHPSLPLLAAADSLAARESDLALIPLEHPPGAATPPPSRWNAHADTVYGIAFHPDGSRIASAGGDGLARVWNTSDGSPLASLEGHTGRVLAVAFQPDGTRIATAALDPEIRVWDMSTFEKLMSLNPRGRTAGWTSLVWPEPDSLLASDTSGEVHRFTKLAVHSGAQSSNTGNRNSVGKADDDILAIACNADRTRIAAGGFDGVIYLWDGDGKLLHRLPQTANP